jgi:hypothetical protein
MAGSGIQDGRFSAASIYSLIESTRRRNRGAMPAPALPFSRRRGVHMSLIVVFMAVLTAACVRVESGHV